jgi:hypothetical protein
MATVATQLNSAAGFSSGETVTAVKLNSLVNSATVTGIVNDNIDAGAAIIDSKLATISTALKVSNSATTATNANTASAIVARDASGNFSAGTITANLTGNVTGNLTGSATTLSTASGSAPVYGCRAFLNFDGTKNASGTVVYDNTSRFITIGSSNVSITRIGTGTYTLTLSPAMSSATSFTVVYSPSAVPNATLNGSAYNYSGNGYGNAIIQSSSTVTLYSTMVNSNQNNVAVDFPINYVHVFGN